MSPAGVALGSSLLELELLLLDSSPGSFGGGCVGNGCCAAASAGVTVGTGELGGVVDLGTSPGKGCSSAADGFFASGGGQGFAV